MMTNCCSTTPCCPMRKQYLENYALHVKIEELEKLLAQSEAELDGYRQLVGSVVAKNRREAESKMMVELGPYLRYAS